jgi:hypothetical protein
MIALPLIVHRGAAAVALVLCTASLPAGSAKEQLDLAGTWHFRLDRGNTGATERWFAHPLTAAIELPGSLPGSGIGDPVSVATKWTGGIFNKSYFTAPEYAAYRRPGNIKVPFWLQPETYFVGAAWFQREVGIPAAWAGRRMVLTLERPHWKTSVWLDDREIGSRDSLSTAHEYDLGTAIAPGRHRLTIRVDNTLSPDIGENSHSITDHTQGNWNGLVGCMALTATAPVWIEELQVFPHVADRTARVQGRLGRIAGQSLPASLRIAGGRVGADPRASVDVAIAADGSFTADYPLGSAAPLWDEFNPVLHQTTATLTDGEQREVRFGLRELAHDGRQLLINGRKLFLRGTLECAAHPRTGHPPTDVAEWKRLIGAVKAHGLNHIRFHSWCPPEAAFIAADELGVYCHVEVGSWPNQSTTLGDGKPVDAWLDAETDRILRAYGNHASFILLCAGNEPGGDHAAAWLSGWVSRQKQRDTRRLYTAGAGWPEVPENDVHVRPDPRIQHWGEGLASRINRLPPETRSDYREFINARAVPVISHEIGQWCVYPNFTEMPKYSGYLKPRNFEIFQASLAAHHMADQAHDFLIASGRQQVLCYKEDIESALRTPGMGGFQLLGLSDFPGQGTALVGVLDAFWEEKGYITPEEFRRFCGSTVPLARLDRRVFTTAETLSADLEVAHFGAAPLAATATAWRLVGDDGRAVASGRLAAREIPVGSGLALGRVELSLRPVPAPARYKLIVALEGTAFENDWDVWVYPADPEPAPSPANVTFASDLDTAAEAKLAAGGTVFLMIPPPHVRPDAQRGAIAFGFSSIFWNTAWTNGQAPHTFGILCNPQHPALASFPTDAHTNWQWWYPIRHAAPMILDGLPPELRPIVQVVDDWFTNRRLALVFEARVGRGRLLVTSIDLAGPDLDPVRRQLRASLLNYAASPKFNPTTSLQAGQIAGLITGAVTPSPP